MNRTITVKGTGKASVSPDQTVVSLTLKSVDKDYDKAMALADAALERLQKALAGAGFEKSDIKTSAFNVTTEYENQPDQRGRYKAVFAGYACTQHCRLAFPMDTALLSRALTAISQSVSEPTIAIQFTVRDKGAVHEELLKNAAKNAREKAEILATAAGVYLGELLSIDYNWDEIVMTSPTDYRLEKACVDMREEMDMDITPEDITVSDSVTFVWEIE